MVRFISALIVLYSLSAQAQFLGFGGDDNKGVIPELIQKLKALDMKVDPAYDEQFNQAVKNIEQGIESEKLFCSGESTNAAGQSLPKEKKQLCMRELRKQYLETMDVIFELKLKYLTLIHTTQLEGLKATHSKLKSEIEKNF